MSQFFIFFIPLSCLCYQIVFLWDFYGLNIYVTLSPKLVCWNVVSDVIVFGQDTFGRPVGHNVRAFITGIRTFQETPESLLSLLPREGSSEGWPWGGQLGHQHPISKCQIKSRLSYLWSSFLLMHWKVSKWWLKNVDTATQVGDSDGAPGCCLHPGPALAAVTVWGGEAVNQWMEAFLTLSFLSQHFK